MEGSKVFIIFYANVTRSFHEENLRDILCERRNGQVIRKRREQDINFRSPLNNKKKKKRKSCHQVRRTKNEISPYHYLTYYYYYETLSASLIPFIFYIKFNSVNLFIYLSLCYFYYY